MNQRDTNLVLCSCIITLPDDGFSVWDITWKVLHTDYHMGSSPIPHNCTEMEIDSLQFVWYSDTELVGGASQSALPSSKSVADHVSSTQGVPGYPVFKCT